MKYENGTRYYSIGDQVGQLMHRCISIVQVIVQMAFPEMVQQFNEL